MFRYIGWRQKTKYENQFNTEGHGGKLIES